MFLLTDFSVAVFLSEFLFKPVFTTGIPNSGTNQCVDFIRDESLLPCVPSNNERRCPASSILTEIFKTGGRPSDGKKGGDQEQKRAEYAPGDYLLNTLFHNEQSPIILDKNKQEVTDGRVGPGFTIRCFVDLSVTDLSNLIKRNSADGIPSYKACLSCIMKLMIIREAFLYKKHKSAFMSLSIRNTVCKKIRVKTDEESEEDAGFLTYVNRLGCKDEQDQDRRIPGVLMFKISGGDKKISPEEFYIPCALVSFASLNGDGVFDGVVMSPKPFLMKAETYSVLPGESQVKNRIEEIVENGGTVSVEYHPLNKLYIVKANGEGENFYSSKSFISCAMFLSSLIEEDESRELSKEAAGVSSFVDSWWTRPGKNKGVEKKKKIWFNISSRTFWLSVAAVGLAIYLLRKLFSK